MNKTPIYLITSYLCCFTVVISAPIILELSTLTPDKGISSWSAVTGDNMGCSISGIGDINQDGIHDFIVGAKKGVVSSSSNPEGYAYVILGNKNGLSNLDLTTPLAPSQGFKITGGNPGDAFGYSVAGIGDYNADGILDFAVGANTADATTSASLNVGHAYILFGKENWGSAPIGALGISTTSPTSPGFRVEGEESNGNLTTEMSIAGDINGDGIVDMLIGAFNEDYGGTAAGCVYVIYGRKSGIQNLVVPSDLTSDRGFKILGPLTNQIGRDVSAAGDFNGDGIDDIAIGAPSAQTTGIGSSYIIFGRKGVRSDIILGNGLNEGEGVTIIGANPGDAFGVAVSSAGDFNGDGYEDVLMGAYHANSNGETNSGAAYVFLGNKNSGSTIHLSQGLKRNQGFQIEAIRANEELGYTLSSAGDVNGDGINDILVGGLPPTALNLDGVIYVIYGRKTGIQDINLANGLNENEGFTIKRTGDKFAGYAFSNAGDVSGDGIDDILIGEYHNSGRGGATVIFGVKFPGIELLKAAVMAQGIITQAAQGLAKLFTLLNSGNAGALFFSALFGLLQYMKYMNIQYPPKLDYILSQPGTDFISIPCISSAPDSVENAVPSYTLPENFEKYDIPSSFLINQWSSFITLIIVITAIVLSCLAAYLTSSCKYINLACSKVKQALKWNYLLATFTGGFGDIAFYTSLEMRTTN